MIDIIIYNNYSEINENDLYHIFSCLSIFFCLDELLLLGIKDKDATAHWGRESKMKLGDLTSTNRLSADASSKKLCRRGFNSPLE